MVSALGMLCRPKIPATLSTPGVGRTLSTPGVGRNGCGPQNLNPCYPPLASSVRFR